MTEDIRDETDGGIAMIPVDRPEVHNAFRHSPTAVRRPSRTPARRTRGPRCLPATRRAAPARGWV